MKKNSMKALLLAVSTLGIAATNTTQAGLLSFLFGSPKPTATWQDCNVDGCKNAGSTTVDSDYAKTKYPIVLGHGAAGFNSIGPLQYWHGISENLTANGASVFVAQQASWNSSEIRGEQLLKQVKNILAITGAKKVNLIGHSHGNQSIRYVAGVMPTSVASVTSVGGPTFGLLEGNSLSLLAEAPLVGDIFRIGLDALFSIVGIASGHYYEQDSTATFKSASKEGIAEFNTKFPAGVPLTACGEGAELASNGVRYYSWSGTGILTNPLDPTDYLMLATSRLLPEENDGLITRCSSHLGKVIRDNYAFNHFDEVNQTLGLVGFLQDPVSVFRQHANRLKNQGL
ncbi:triacylglycerol lipase [Acinetobacter junii]